MGSHRRLDATGHRSVRTDATSSHRLSGHTLQVHIVGRTLLARGAGYPRHRTSVSECICIERKERERMSSERERTITCECNEHIVSAKQIASRMRA